MIPIKFRGKRLDTGEYVCGDFAHVVPMSSFTGIIDCDGFVHEIQPGSERQLVGYDANGKELYDGDTVLRYDSEDEFIEFPENGVLREISLFTQVTPDLNAYYCLVKEAD